MSWKDAREGVRQMVAACLGFKGKRQVTWEGQNDNDGWVADQCAVLRLTSRAGNGTDEERRFLDTDGILKTVLCGVRQFTVTAFLESQSQSDDAAVLADMEEALRTKLRSSRLQGLYLQPVQVALLRIHEAYGADYVDQDGREVSRAAVDLRFSYASNILDDFYADTPGYVNEVQGTGTYTTGNGQISKDIDVVGT